ncbi:hypothetical protein BJ912DRAFT_1059896 [Pholiota molesta]|nr:hypothetical protein BJ912DRAFT_1059896 [Pholiota molesta]
MPLSIHSYLSSTRPSHAHSDRVLLPLVAAASRLGDPAVSAGACGAHRKPQPLHRPAARPFIHFPGMRSSRPQPASTSGPRSAVRQRRTDGRREPAPAGRRLLSSSLRSLSSSFTIFQHLYICLLSSRDGRDGTIAIR